MKLNQRGTATLLGIGAMAIVLLIVITGLILVNLSGKLVAKQLLYKGQAYNAAEAGLVNALTWFRTQNTQPVVTFDPKVDATTDPPLNESDNPGIGVVRDFDVSDLGSVKGRFEVRKEQVDLDNDGTVDWDYTGTGLNVIDRSEERGKDAAGRVWQLESLGIIYVDHEDNGMDWVDNASSPDGRPQGGEGEVLVTQTLRADIQRLTTILPGGAAIISEGLSAVSNKARVRGISGIGAIYAGTNNPCPPTGGAELSGTPQCSQASPFQGSIDEVFGVTEQELNSMADRKGTLSQIPVQLPGMQLIVIDGEDGPVTFDSSRPLIGSGILVVLDGDLIITANSNANFNGIIYVRGTYSQNSPSLVSGTVMVVKKSDGTGGTATITGSGGDFSEIDYDPDMIQLVQNQLGQYRFSRAPYLVSLN